MFVTTVLRITDKQRSLSNPHRKISNLTMSQKLGPEDLVNESLDEEMERKGTSPIPDWLNVKKQVRSSSSAPGN